MDLTKTLNALFTSLNSHVDRGFAAMIKTAGGTKDVSKAIGEQTSALKIIFGNFSKALEKVEHPSFDVVVEMKPIQDRLDYILAQIKTQKMESMKPLYDELKAIRILTQENQPEKLGERFDVLDAIFKGLKPKDSVKFDDTQMKGLMAALTNAGNGGFGTQSGNKSATRYNVQRLSMPTANTEYTFTFPQNTVSWTMKQRVAGASLLYASVTGMFPTTGNDTNYMTLLPMGARSQDNVEWGGVKMFLQSDTASQVIEFEIFQM